MGTGLQEWRHALRPDTPVEIRRSIRKLEMERYRMYIRLYRIGIAIEAILTAALVVCLVHFYMEGGVL